MDIHSSVYTQNEYAPSSKKAKVFSFTPTSPLVTSPCAFAFDSYQEEQEEQEEQEQQELQKKQKKQEKQELQKKQDLPSQLWSDTHWTFVCVPGVPGSEWDFRYLAPYLSQLGDVVRLVYPGFGLLENHPKPLSTLKSRGLYLADVIRSQGWRNVIIIAHSMGGAAALMCASAHHDSSLSSLPSLRGVVFLCSVGLRKHQGMALSPQVIRLLYPLTFLPFFGSILIHLTRKSMLKMGFKGHSLDTKQIRLIYQIARSLNFKLLTKRVSSITVPCLCLSTPDDPLVEHDIGKELSEALASVTSTHLHQLQEGKHNPHRFIPDALVEQIDHWMSSIESSFKVK